MKNDKVCPKCKGEGDFEGYCIDCYGTGKLLLAFALGLLIAAVLALSLFGGG